MTTTEKQSMLRERRWEKSRYAELRGKYQKAYEIHQEILVADGDSYAGLMRAGWLCFRLGAYEDAIRFYERAGEISDDNGPSQGIKDCLVALGDTHTPPPVHLSWSA